MADTSILDPCAPEHIDAIDARLDTLDRRLAALQRQLDALAAELTRQCNDLHARLDAAEALSRQPPNDSRPACRSCGGRLKPFRWRRFANQSQHVETRCSMCNLHHFVPQTPDAVMEADTTLVREGGRANTDEGAA